MPKVSVIIPAYNHEAYIGEAIESVLRQTMTSLALIVIDDGSTDNTLKVIQGFSDPRMTVIFQENKGAHAALNRGLKQAEGPLVTILNSDDVYADNRLETMVSYMESHPEVALAGTYIEVIDSQGESMGIKHGYHDLSPWPLEDVAKSFRGGKDLKEALWGENYLATTSNFVFRQALVEKGLAFQSLRYVHDWDFALKASECGEIALLPEPLLQYRIHDSNTIRENEAEMIFEILWLLAVHLPSRITQKWLDSDLPEQQIARLLHSFHTFGVNHVLTTMLLQNLSQHPDKAAALLMPGNPIRATFLAYIQQHLSQNSLSPKPPARSPLHKLRRFLTKIYAK